MTKTESPQPRNPRATPADRGSLPASTVFKSILCAVDGTRASTAAVRMAARLAGPQGHLTLLTVTGVSGSGPHATAAISPKRVEQMLKAAKKVAHDLGAQATTMVDPGAPPVKVILERACDHDLLVIGAPATSWLAEMLVGGVASTALSQFTTPMLVVRRNFKGSLQGSRIIVASDGEQASDRVVDIARALSQSLDGHLTLLNAIGPESKMHPRNIQAQARTLGLGEDDVLVEPGKPVEMILDAAQRISPVLLVLGSRRLGGLRALGSVSRKVVHDAPCSVLLLPPQSDQ